MSAPRRNQAVLTNVWHDLVDSWSDEASQSDDESPSTGVFSRRPPRDSYTQERPLLTITFDLHAEDLYDFEAPRGDERFDIHVRPTRRP